MTTIEKSQIRDLRLLLLTVLSGVYVVAFWALGRKTKVAEAPAPGPNASTVWYGELPAPERPAIALPPGWVVAGAQPPAAPVARFAQARPRRIRTRSS